MRTSNTNKQNKTKQIKKQTNCRLQASICYFSLYVILLECLFVFSLLYWFRWDLLILMRIYSWVRNLTDYLPFKRGENSFSLWLCLSKKWWFTLNKSWHVLQSWSEQSNEHLLKYRIPLLIDLWTHVSEYPNTHFWIHTFWTAFTYDLPFTVVV